MANKFRHSDLEPKFKPRVSRRETPLLAVPDPSLTRLMLDSVASCFN